MAPGNACHVGEDRVTATLARRRPSLLNRTRASSGELYLSVARHEATARSPLQIELVAGRHPSVAGARSLQEANRGKWHVKAGHRDLVGRHHVENSFAARDCHVLDIIETSRPIGPL